MGPDPCGTFPLREDHGFYPCTTWVAKFLMLHHIALVCYARVALAPYTSVLADTAPSALIARADARPSAFLARAPLPIVQVDACPSALLAPAPYPSVLADARPSAVTSALLAPAPIYYSSACEQW